MGQCARVRVCVAKSAQGAEKLTVGAPRRGKYKNVKVHGLGVENVVKVGGDEISIGSHFSTQNQNVWCSEIGS